MMLGKHPATPGAVKLKLKDYINTSVLPTPPWNFGFDNLVNDDQGAGRSWDMLGNDQWGDCVEAGAAHETMVLNAQAGKVVTFSRDSVLADYSAATGFNPNDPSTDRGTWMPGYASYRKKTGIVDANGVRHKVGAYLAITPRDIEETITAAYVFGGAVGIGFSCPNTIFQQFSNNEAWHVVPGTHNVGGHYVPFVAHRKSMLRIVTWGREQFMKPGYFENYNDETLVYLSEEMLTGGVSLNGFDLAHLQADLAAL